MKVLSLFLSLLLFVFAVPAQAVSTTCPKPTTQAIPENTTVFFYQRFKNKKTYYIPMMVMKDGKLTGIGSMLMPAQVIIFNLRDDQPITIHFKNTFNPMEMACQSLGEVETPAAQQSTPPTQLYANKIMSSAFNFQPEQADMARFLASISNPCKPGQSNYDKNGVAVCNADKLLATSDLLKEKQYWQLRQYRYDVGLVVNTWDSKDQKFRQLVEDCTVCSD